MLNLQAIGANVERASKDAIWKAGALLEERLKVKLSQAGTGKTWPKRYIKRGNRYGTHMASEPGQPPAVDDGRLRSSITHNVTGRPGGKLPDPGGGMGNVKGYVGTNVNYGMFLEFGVNSMHPFGNVGVTSSIEPRPWLYVTVSENANNVSNVISGSLKDAIKKAKVK